MAKVRFMVRLELNNHCKKRNAKTTADSGIIMYITAELILSPFIYLSNKTEGRMKWNIGSNTI